jgi:hypothetical protein
MQEASLLVDYIYLDSEERRRFAQVGHEYLIEQLQFTGEESAQTKTVKVKLGFNHPTKELVWALRNGNYFPSSSTPNAFLGYSHTDDWTSALQDAANNLAAGMVSIQESGQSATAYDGMVLVGATAGSPQNFIGNVALSSGHSILVDLRFQDNTHFTNGVPDVPYDIYLHDTPFFSNGAVDLANNLSAMTIVVTQANAGGGGIENFTVSVVVTAHSLDIPSLSIPVALWDDNRFNTGNGMNDNDILVYQYHNYGVYIDGSQNPIRQALVQLNGHDRFDIREGQYFNYVQPYQHHSRTPCDGINVYSFALHPEQHQPSGTANLSRIDNTQLNLFFVSTTDNGGLDVAFLNSDSVSLLCRYLKASCNIQRALYILITVTTSK